MAAGRIGLYSGVGQIAQLLTSLEGKPAAARLMGKFGGLSSLAQASFADLQQVPGGDPSRAAAIRSALLLAQRLVRET